MPVNVWCLFVHSYLPLDLLALGGRPHLPVVRSCSYAVLRGKEPEKLREVIAADMTMRAFYVAAPAQA